MRNDLGFDQRTSQEVGDAVEVVAQILAPAAVSSVAKSFFAAAGISKFRGNLSGALTKTTEPKALIKSGQTNSGSANKTLSKPKDKYLLTGRSRTTTGPGKTEPMLRKGEKPSERPTWRQSEIDVITMERQAGHTVQDQASFLNGAPESYGTKGSIRVDGFVDGKYAHEVKNFDLINNRSGLIKSITDQAIKNQLHLPPNTTQRFTIDVRGQICTPEIRLNILDRVLSRTNGILSISDIEFFGI
jgi:hypothetical protein